MQGQVLNRQPTRAGFWFPAMHSSLRHFLSVSLDPDTDKWALVRAVERDPAILVALLACEPRSAADLSTWHEHIESSLLRAIAIAMSNAAAIEPATRSGHTPKPDALAQSLVAEALARQIDGANVTEARLVALLSGIGECLVAGGDPVDIDAAAADYLLDVGCSRGACDAVRYRREPAAQLHGATLPLRINALAARLVHYIDGPQMLPAQLLADCLSLTDLAESVIYDSIGRAGRALELCMADAGEPALDTAETARGCLAELASTASIGAVFYRALVKTGEDRPWHELVGQVGRLLFGFSGACHFTAGPDGGMVAELGDQPMEIDTGRTDSHILRCWRDQRMMVVTRSRATDLFERQLLARFGANHLLCLPLPKAGVIVCGIDQSFAENIDRHSVLLAAYGDAAADTYQRRVGRDADVITLDELQKRAREITHEVNNPLAIVQNYLGTLSIKLGEGAPGQKEIAAIRSEINRVGSIMQKYAQIGRAEELVWRRVDLNGLLDELLAVVAGSEKHLSVDTRYDSAIPMMELPADSLRQVVLNLLKNAVEALRDTENGKVTVTSQGAVNVGGKHYFEIVVSDNGPGMSHEQRLELFNNRVSTKGDERGLGLGIVARMIDEMSGIITCRENTSVPGESGTSFQILLPLGQD